MEIMRTIAVSALLLCFICLSDAANSVENYAPIIHSYREDVSEDIPEGGYAFTINATDQEDDRLRYSISGPFASFFKANPDTGVVTVKAKLDRESQNIMKFQAHVSDRNSAATKELIIILMDANDNFPIFKESPYSCAIPENTTVHTILFTVTATDGDSGPAASVRYNIDEVIPVKGKNLFSIMPNGQVRLNGRLNYTSLSPFYQLKINASDGGGMLNGTHVIQSNVALAFITVLDVADLDPRFLGLPYRAPLEEGSPVGTVVFTVEALDQDTGISNKILFSIENSTNSRAAELFNISEYGGVISVKSEIDREAIGDSITLTVKALEDNLNTHGNQAFALADVQISILDRNDNKPEFEICKDECAPESNFTAEIFEHSTGTILINMRVKDIDKDGEIELMLQGADEDVFSVTPSFAISESAVQLVVKNTQKLDYEEKEEMVVQVVAIDRSNSTLRSTATVVITLKDTNDNSPKFKPDTYEASVQEHSTAGTFVANITAEDRDKMDKGKLTYTLLPDSMLKYFELRPGTGVVCVKNSTLIDREVGSQYSVTLQARDTDNNTGTAVLEITLIDINDQTPVFNRESYTVLVKEGEQLELTIQATDADEPETNNSRLAFGIASGPYSDNFTIDSRTGVLRSKGPLDREALDPALQGRVELNVTATDQGSPPRFTTVKVIVNVEDTNDNPPEFKEASYEFSVAEGLKGTFVGSVRAEDLDQSTVFNRISFSIVAGSFGSFIVRPFADAGEGWAGYRGDIYVDPDIELDYESVPNNFTLRLEAANLAQGTADVTVRIKVLDVNDERPEFGQLEAVTLKENTTWAGAVGWFAATDRDGTHSLVYELQSTKCRCSGTLQPCSWVLLNSSGEVTVNAKETLDYEQCDQVVVKARVVDVFTQKGENDSAAPGVMVINIEDINDNTPEFIASDSVFVVVSESASKGTSVAGVTAVDRDSGINRQITFKVVEVRFQDSDNQISSKRTIFEAVTTQQKEDYVGIIQSMEELDTTLKGKYLVTVAATDPGGLSSSTVLEIFTIDKSFKIELRFASPLEEVTNNLGKITVALTAATKAMVEIVALKPETEDTRAPENTLMEAYFVYSNGTAISSEAVEKMLSKPEHFVSLGQLGLTYIGDVAVEDQAPDPIRYILLGIVGGLIIVLTVLATSMICTRRSYRTKLKAAKALNSASMAVTENQKSGPVVPGTNKYTMEGANPVLNLNIDTVTDLGFDEEHSNTDRVSLNSWDYNMDLSDKDALPMMMIREEDEESEGAGYTEPLGAALAEHRVVEFSRGFDNPSLSTTDL